MTQRRAAAVHRRHRLLAARGSGALYRTANPARVDPAGLPALLDGVAVVVLRLLGGRRAWPDGRRRAAGVRAAGRAAGRRGRAGRRADGRVDRAGRGGRPRRWPTSSAGGPDNLRELHRFLSDTVLLTGEGFAPPAADAGVRRARRAPRTTRRGRRSASSSTGRTSCPATPRSSTCCATRSRPAARTRCRCSAARCAAREPELMELLGAGATRWSPRCWRPAARSRRTRARAATRTPGTPARWPRSTCRCCRGCA